LRAAAADSVCAASGVTKAESPGRKVEFQNLQCFAAEPSSEMGMGLYWPMTVISLECDLILGDGKHSRDGREQDGQADFN